MSNNSYMVQHKLSYDERIKANLEKGLNRFANFPASNEAESSIIGCILMQPKIIDEVLQIINVDDFFNTKFAKIFECLIELNEKDEPIDLVTLRNKIKEKHYHTFIGGDPTLLEINRTTPSWASYKKHSLIVLEKSMIRKFASMIGKKYYDIADGENILDAIDDLKTQLDELRPITKSENNAAVRFQEFLQRIWNKEIISIPTGYNNLDSLIEGFGTSEYIIIAARPKVGKTTFVLNIIYKQILNKFKVKFFSLEQPAEQIVMKLVSLHCGVGTKEIKGDKLNHSQELKKLQILDYISKYLVIVDSLFEKKEIIRDIYSEDFDCYYIDYNELILDNTKKSVFERLVGISTDMVQVCKKRKRPIVMIQQINRDVTKQKKKTPVKLSDLKYTGEQDAYKIIMLDRELKEKETTVSIVANRDGEVGELDYIYHYYVNKFIEEEIIQEVIEKNWQDKEYEENEKFAF